MQKTKNVSRRVSNFFLHGILFALVFSTISLVQSWSKSGNIAHSGLVPVASADTPHDPNNNSYDGSCDSDGSDSDCQ